VVNLAAMLDETAGEPQNCSVYGSGMGTKSKLFLGVLNSHEEGIEVKKQIDGSVWAVCCDARMGSQSYASDVAALP